MALAVPAAAVAESGEPPERADAPPAGASDRPAAEPTTGAGGQPQADNATEPGSKGAGQPEQFVNRLPERYKLSNWLGKSVVNSQGETLGRVEDLVIDDLGMARYIVLETEVLGEEHADRLIAVPAGHFSYPPVREGSLVLDVSLGRFTRAPRFGTAGWPNMGEKTFSSVVVGYWLPEEASDRYGSQDGGDASAEAKRAADKTQGSEPRADGQPREFHPDRDTTYLSADKRLLFVTLDRNRDGVIDRDEAARNHIVSAQFEAIDTFANDVITRSELAAVEIPVSGSGQ
ncbi:MAG: PRC-barrel domain-containing protein [Thiohalocapsa sp.]|nr:PRC-barrel domain-containing protein [Thiohalocapsa sp.]